MIKDCTASELVYMVMQFNNWFLNNPYDNGDSIAIGKEVYEDLREYCDQTQIEWDYEYSFKEVNSISKIFRDALHATQSKPEPLTRPLNIPSTQEERDNQYAGFLKWREDQCKQPR